MDSLKIFSSIWLYLANPLRIHIISDTSKNNATDMAIADPIIQDNFCIYFKSRIKIKKITTKYHPELTIFMCLIINSNLLI